MNKVQLMGRLVRDPELKELTSGKKVANFTLAIDYAKDKDGNKLTNFIPCMAWERKGEVITQYFGKGQRMLVTDGMMMVRNYVDANTQEKKIYTYVKVNDFEFVETKVSAEAVNGSSGQMAGSQQGGDSAGQDWSHAELVDGANNAQSAKAAAEKIAAGLDAKRARGQDSFFDVFGDVNVPF